MAEKNSRPETRTRGESGLFHKPSKKTIVSGAAVLLLGALVFAAVSTGLPDRILGGGKEISFTQLKKDDIPQTIEKDVIPEYRELERALGCLVDGKVYVVVTRGEKPTAGYDLAIEQIQYGRDRAFQRAR